MNNDGAIAPLTKVSLHIRRCDEDGEESVPRSKVNFDFVFGIATEGFTAFEKALFNKVPGEKIRIHIEPPQMQLFFDYLASPLMEALGAGPPFELDVQVAAVSPVSDRELVHALARKTESAGCGCGCAGGCGC